MVATRSVAISQRARIEGPANSRCLVARCLLDLYARKDSRSDWRPRLVLLGFVVSSIAWAITSPVDVAILFCYGPCRPVVVHL